ncbi:histidine kinase [Chitinophaga niabensis]|uniref:Signal transduction histidine kinase internal region domain-containing protein n=1 Tax=Chitinophaga niabensis TaxID=536979 RepID=A0A1N6DH50_9BACT|nr:histidine kinase [Chitinophaga niabensis]SIN70149.1 hypothetical protein SAMN04488055_0747 [Chitinophaga niabensis]
MLSSKPYRYLVHLAIWMALVMLYISPQILANFSSSFGMQWVLVRYIVYGFINFQLFYLLVFVVFPLKGKKPVVAVILTLLAFCLIKYGAGLIFPDLVLQKAIALIGVKKTYLSFSAYSRIALQTSLLVAFAAYAYYIFIHWRSSDKGSRELERSLADVSRQYERMHLSSQLLLRKLKALEDVLKVEEKRDQEGVECILQLSELLRYMLYDKSVQREKASLQKELHFYNIYLKLHNRLFPQQMISLQINGSTAGFSIEPLLLQSATEQLLQQQSSPAPFTVELHIQPDSLSLKATQKAFKTPLYPELA